MVPKSTGPGPIANHFKLDFVSYYDEPGNGITGKASYKKGILLENETPISEKMIEEKKVENPYFKTTSSMTKKDLNQLYGELPEGDLLLKIAEHKNFNKAREVFQAMDELTIVEIDKYLINTSHYGPEEFANTDKYVAMAFLKQLVSEWNQQRRHPEVNNAPSQ